MAKKKYTADNITAMEGVEQIRHRPGMWVGEVTAYKLFREILDNAVDEHLAQEGNQIEVVLSEDKTTISIRDYGRGIPTGLHKKTGKPALTTVFTTLFSGGKFDDKVYATAGGLHGVGSVVVNALSSHLKVRVWRDGHEWQQEFSRGTETTKLRKVGKATKKQSGTEVTFTPDTSLEKQFEEIQFDPQLISERLEEVGYLCPGLTLVFQCGKKTTTYSSTGLTQFVTDWAPKGESLLGPLHVSDKEGKDRIEAAILFVDSSERSVYSYCNVVETPQHGRHYEGFLDGLEETLVPLGKKEGFEFTRNELMEGLSGVIHVLLKEPSYSSQSKERLVTKTARALVKKCVTRTLTKLVGKEDLTQLFEKLSASYQAKTEAQDWKEIAKKLRKQGRRKNDFLMVGGLSECSNPNPAERELFIVEGESAAGTAKMGRDPHTQAILAMRGKILNVLRFNPTRALDNGTLRAIADTIGTNIIDKCVVEKTRYGKIIILADADSDGHHIACLLLVLFHQWFRPLLEAGCVYVAEPPLFGASKGKKRIYGNTRKELKRAIGKNPQGWRVTRFKGLGEMNADQLQYVALDPATRVISQIKPGALDQDDIRVDQLMGSDSSHRKKLLFGDSDDSQANGKVC